MTLHPMELDPDDELAMALPEISAAQLRAARALLDWSRDETARHCRVSLVTMRRFENGERIPTAKTMSDIVSALEANGIIFVSDQNSEGVSKTRGPATLPPDHE